MPQFLDSPTGAPKFSLRSPNIEIVNYYPLSYEALKNETLKREMMQGYYASVSYMDAQVGKVLQTLKETKLDENTVIVFWSDHGWHLGDHDRWSKHDNFEQTTRIPLIFSGKGIAKNQVTSQMASSVDLYPTLASWCGLAPPKGPQPIDGHDLSSNLKSPSNLISSHNYITHCFNMRRPGYFGHAVRNKQYRLVKWKKKNHPPIFELYDLINDPLETENKAHKLPDVVNQLKETLSTYPLVTKTQNVK